MGIRALQCGAYAEREERCRGAWRPASFAGVTFAPGCFIYVDTDGMLLAERDLLG